MTDVECLQCGMINRLADETCRQCGAELRGMAVSYQPAASEFYTPPAGAVHPEANETAFQPTVVIGRFDSIGDVLTPTIDLFKDNIWLITKLVFVIFAPYEIFKTMSYGTVQRGWKFGAGIFFLSLVCKALIAPSLIYALMTVMRTGVAPSLQESYRWGLSRLGKLVAVAVMAWILEMLGFICLIIPGIILGLAFELIYPMATLEDASPVEILKRSYHMTTGYRWQIFLASFVLGLLCSVVSIPAGIVSGVLIGAGITFWPVHALLSLITDIIYEATTVLSLVIYLSLLSETPAKPVTWSGAVEG